MSFTNKTPNYDLPQYVATDKPTYLVDANGAYLAIDTAMKANETSAATAQSTADTNTAAISTLNTQINGENGLAADLTAVETLAATTAGSVNTINSLIGNGEPTTTDKTLVGAINELDADLNGAGGTAATVEAIEENLNGSYVYTGDKGFTATGDGVKTYSALLDELATAVSNYITAKDSTYAYRPCILTPGDSFNTNLDMEYRIIGNTFSSFLFKGMRVTTTGFHMSSIYLATSGSYYYKLTETLTPTDESATVPANGATLRVWISEYKHI